METLAKTFIIPAWQNQFIQVNIFKKAPVRRIAIPMNTFFIHCIVHWKTILVSKT